MFYFSRLFLMKQLFYDKLKSDQFVPHIAVTHADNKGVTFKIFILLFGKYVVVASFVTFVFVCVCLCLLLILCCMSGRLFALFGILFALIMKTNYYIAIFFMHQSQRWTFQNWP